jgi:hypothetical protein
MQRLHNFNVEPNLFDITPGLADIDLVAKRSKLPTGQLRSVVPPASSELRVLSLANPHSSL